MDAGYLKLTDVIPPDEDKNFMKIDHPAPLGKPPEMLAGDMDIGSYDQVLRDNIEITRYIVSLSTHDISEEMVEEYYRGSKAELKLMPISDLQEGHQDHNIPNKSKERRYAKLDVGTIPPLVVQNGLVEDGNHRLREAIKKGTTHIWCYCIT
jgi:hypothetical protein